MVLLIWSTEIWLTVSARLPRAWLGNAVRHAQLETFAFFSSEGWSTKFSHKAQYKYIFWATWWKTRSKSQGFAFMTFLCWPWEINALQFKRTNANRQKSSRGNIFTDLTHNICAAHREKATKYRGRLKSDALRFFAYVFYLFGAHFSSWGVVSKYCKMVRMIIPLCFVYLQLLS